MAKIALSTPELDKLAMRTDFALPTPGQSLNTFLRNDEDDDKIKLAQNWANATKLQNIKTEDFDDDVKFIPTIRNSCMFSNSTHFCKLFTFFFSQFFSRQQADDGSTKYESRWT